jgi:hypothetical protein
VTTPKIGAGRSLGFILSLDWPTGIATRVTVASLVPARVTEASVQRFSKTMHDWLRKHPAKVERGAYLVKILDRQALYADAVCNLDGFTFEDFADIAAAQANTLDRLRSRLVPLGVEKIVKRELAWLETLDRTAALNSVSGEC